MDLNKEQLSIKSYGVGVTTLEEVFLKVGDGVMPNDKNFEKEGDDLKEAIEDDDYTIVDESLSGFKLFMV
jgi:hypothetical protein